MVKIYSFGLWREQKLCLTNILFCLVPCFAGGKAAWRSLPCQHSNVAGVGFLSAFVLPVQFPFIISWQNPSPLTSSEKFSQILLGYFSLGLSPQVSGCTCLSTRLLRALSIKALPVFMLPEGRLFSIFVSASISQRPSSYALSESSWTQLPTQSRGIEARSAGLDGTFPTGCKMAQEPTWHPHWPPFLKALHVCSLPLESSSSGKLLLATL